MMMMGGGSDSGDGSMYNLLVTNLAYQQPLSPFFVLVHSSETMPLFKYGMPASPELAELAEDGSPASLVAMYENMDGVCEAKVSPKQVHALANGMILRQFAYIFLHTFHYPTLNICRPSLRTHHTWRAILLRSLSLLATDATTSPLPPWPSTLTTVSSLSTP